MAKVMLEGRPELPPEEVEAVECRIDGCGELAASFLGLCKEHWHQWCSSPESDVGRVFEAQQRTAFVARVNRERAARADTAESPAVQPAQGAEVAHG